MANAEDRALRDQLVKFLRGGEAHADLKAVLDDFPAKARGVVLKGAVHSPWQELEHIRIALHDLLDFSTNPSYVAPEWPKDYWPKEGCARGRCRVGRFGPRGEKGHRGFREAGR